MRAVASKRHGAIVDPVGTACRSTRDEGANIRDRPHRSRYRREAGPARGHIRVRVSDKQGVCCRGTIAATATGRGSVGNGTGLAVLVHEGPRLDTHWKGPCTLTLLGAVRHIVCHIGAGRFRVGKGSKDRVSHLRQVLEGLVHDVPFVKALVGIDVGKQ